MANEKIDKNETNENTKKEILDGAKYNDNAKSNAVGIGHLVGEYIKLVGYSHTRGTPTQYNKGNGEDNMADYYTANLSEPISVTIVSKKDQSKSTNQYNSVFLKDTILKQLKNIPEALEELEKQNATIKVRVGTRWSDKNSKYYYCVFFVGQKEYDTKDTVFKTNS